MIPVNTISLTKDHEMVPSCLSSAWTRHMHMLLVSTVVEPYGHHMSFFQHA